MRRPVGSAVVEPLANLPPELAPLWQAVHSRLSSGRRPVSRVRIGPLNDQQQTGLLGLPRLPGELPSVSPVLRGRDGGIAFGHPGRLRGQPAVPKAWCSVGDTGEAVPPRPG